MENWKEKAVNILKDSLYPIPTELNELDWKSGLSPKTDRLAQHICAFSNLQGGGILVFGINNDSSLSSVSKENADEIITKLGNIAKNNLSTAISIEHSIITFENHYLLFVYIPEQHDKPTHLRGSNIYDSYIRSAGQTVKMTKKQVQILISQSQGVPFEDMNAMTDLTEHDILDKLNYKKLFELLERNTPSNNDSILNTLLEYGFVEKQNNVWSIKNLGAILFANNIQDFPSIRGRSVVVRLYSGTNNRELYLSQEGVYGYAVGFNNLIDFIIGRLPKIETFDTLRKDKPLYPKVAIREFVANAILCKPLHKMSYVKSYIM